MESSSDNGNALDMHQGLDTAIKSNLVPFQEYFLHGSIYDDHVDKLLDRLKGLCDIHEKPSEFFEDHEMIYKIHRPPDKPLRLRVRRSMVYKDNPYMVRYLGITETGDWYQPTSIRTSIDVGVSSSIVEFLEQLGYIREYEYVANGYIFKKGRMKITVSKIHVSKETRKTNITPRRINILSGMSESHLVEMSVVVPASRQAIGTEMKQFAESLKPLVFMGKDDQIVPP